jgi:hypothetical protein
MGRPFSNDLRERVVAAVVGGELPGGSSVFGVAVSSVVKWSQRYRATGSVAPGNMGGRRKPVLEPHRASSGNGSARRHIGRFTSRRTNSLRAASTSRTMRFRCSCGAKACGSKKTLFALEQTPADVARRCPRGAKPGNRSPFGPHPRSGVMLVLIQASSMKTR